MFGSGDGAVLVEPEVARDLRSAAESASQEGRITGGLLYGQALADDEGKYLVVDGFLESAPGENPRMTGSTRDGHDNFTLDDADLRLLRQDAARMYPATLEAGWWRTLDGAGRASRPRDFGETQGELVEPGGVGLLVFGSGPDLGIAYLGPDARQPPYAGPLVPAQRPTSRPGHLPRRASALASAGL